MAGLLSAEAGGSLGSIEIVKVIADRPCRALHRAEQAGIESVLLEKGSVSAEDFDRALLRETVGPSDLILLAGYLSIVSPAVLAFWGDRALNIHPSLLPAYGGKGMYGMRVHRAVLAAGEPESGCTLHRVSSEIDGGEILSQRRLRVGPDETAESLAVRVQALEKELLIAYLSHLSENDIVDWKGLRK